MPPHIFEVGLKVSTKVYLDVLKSVVILCRNQVTVGRPWVWQQDSVPAHKSKETQAWLQNSATTLNPSLTGPSSLDLNLLDYYVFHTSRTSPTWPPTKPKSPNLLGRKWLNIIKWDWSEMFYIGERKGKPWQQVIDKCIDIFPGWTRHYTRVEAHIHGAHSATPRYFKLRLPWPWLGCLAFVPYGVSKSMVDSRLKGPQFRLGHLRVGELQHWDLCPLCIALNLAV